MAKAKDFKTYDVIIVGGGASGMMASIMARRRDRHVILIEKNEKLGKKILVTGNGRCNITNENSIEDCKTPVHYHGQNPKFVLSAFNQFNVEDTKIFFNELGIEFKEEDNGRLFPSSNQAQSVVDVLEYEMTNLGVKIANKNYIKKIEFNKDNGLYEVEISDGRKLQSKKVVVALGGKTHSILGASADGYAIAEQFGHKIISTFPAYVPLNVKSTLCHRLQGVKLEVEVKAFVKDKVIAQNRGTLMFAHFGLSAPVVLEMSRQIAEEMDLKGNKVKLNVNFLPDIPQHELDAFIVDRWAKAPQKSLGFSFVGLLPHKVFPAILEAEGIDPTIKVATINKELRHKILKMLSEYTFTVESIRDFDEAHFTAGGVDTKEIDPKTLESKLQPGLFFCGEVLDIDGDCGGYNLQWAWTSGAVAGNSV